MFTAECISFRLGTFRFTEGQKPFRGWEHIGPRGIYVPTRHPPTDGTIRLWENNKLIYAGDTSILIKDPLYSHLFQSGW